MTNDFETTNIFDFLVNGHCTRFGSETMLGYLKKDKTLRYFLKFITVKLTSLEHRFIKTKDFKFT